MLDLAKFMANAWVTWWVVGLVMSYRMIVPARQFLSERSAKWLADTLRHDHADTVRRRFGVSFKRYVDRTFGARARTIAGCRFWSLSYRRSAAISFFTFLVIYIAVLLSIDFDLVYAGIDEMRRGMQDPTHPDYTPSVAPFAGMIDHVDVWILAATMMIFNGLVLGLFNTITDYLSFIETRNVLARLGHGPLRDIGLVLLDILLTSAISIAGFMLFWVLTTSFGTILSGRNLGVEHMAMDGIALGVSAIGKAFSLLWEGRPALDLTDPAMISMTLSTYATSIWIWVFFVATSLMRAVVLIGPLLRLVRFLVDVEDHPFRAAWLMFALVWSVGVGLAALT